MFSKSVFNILVATLFLALKLFVGIVVVAIGSLLLIFSKLLSGASLLSEKRHT